MYYKHFRARNSDPELNPNMKAIVCEAYGLPSTLVYRDVDDPVPGDRQVLIEVAACGVNFPDTLIIQGLYQFKPTPPFSPGSDIAGTVMSVGSKVKHLKPGDEVVAMTAYGGFAEKAVVDANLVFPKPPGMSMTHAASFLMAYGTSYYALTRRAKLKAGETVLVLGAAGGVGLTAIQIAKQLGATVIAAASSDEKLAVCKESGADLVINYSTEDLKTRAKELTNGNGVDVVYDPVGGDYAEPALRAIAWEGRYLVIGFAAGDIPKIPLNLALLKGCQIVGVFWGSYAQRQPQDNMADAMQLITWFNEGKITPHIHGEYTLEDAPQALEDMLARKVKGKAIIVVTG